TTAVTPSVCLAGQQSGECVRRRGSSGRQRKLQEGARLAVGSRVRTRARRGSLRRKGKRTQESRSAGRRSEIRQGSDERCGGRFPLGGDIVGRRRRAGSIAVAAGRLRQVRPGRGE